MKKTLIALAALAATASFAQSSVTLSGNLDFAYGTVGGTQAWAKGTTVSTRSGVASTTSVINIIAVEDLGGGMKATVKYGIDPRHVANDDAAVTNSADTNATKNTVTALGKDELFVGIEGGFGNVRLGSPNSIGLRSHLDSSPLGTGIGSGYTGGGTAALMTMRYSNIRYNRSISYDSPNFNGFVVSALYAPGNDQPQISETVALNIPNNRNVTELGLSYANGPLKVSYANISQDAQKYPTGWYSAAATNSVKTSANVLNANYKLGSTTLYAGWNKGDALASTTSVTPTKGWRVAAKQNLGAIDLIAQYTQQETSGLKAKVTGLRADYSLSKTTVAYVGYEKFDTGAAYDATSATTKAASGDRTVASVGLRKSF